MPHMEKGGTRTTPDLHFPAGELEMRREGRRVKLETNIPHDDDDVDGGACNFGFLSLFFYSFPSFSSCFFVVLAPFGSPPHDHADGCNGTFDKDSPTSTKQHRLQTTCNPKEADLAPKHSPSPPITPQRKPRQVKCPATRQGSGSCFSCRHCARRASNEPAWIAGSVGKREVEETGEEEEKGTGNRRQTHLMEVDSCWRAALTPLGAHGQNHQWTCGGSVAGI